MSGRRRRSRPPDTQENHVEGDEARQEEQQVGLDSDTEAEEKTAKAPAVVEEHIEGGVKAEHGHGVVEEMEDGDAAGPRAGGSRSSRES